MPARTVNDAINQASFIKIDAAIKKIKREQINRNRLIGPHNRYKKKTIDKIKSDVTTNTINTSHAEQYIASSIIQHCYDGWNYFSRGVEAYLSGDNSVSIHLIYYAELRAVMSIMASHGIGIFSQKNLFSDGTTIHHFPGNTHKVADELFKEWSNSSLHAPKLTDIIRINNRKLIDWIAPTGLSAGAYSTNVIKDFLEQWSVDLKLEGDQQLRNEMSYRPRYESSSTLSEIALENVIAIWKQLEPNEADRFSELDLHLFRKTLENLYKQAKGKQPTGAKYLAFLTHMFNSLGESTNQYLFRFLQRQVSPVDHIVLRYAAKDSKNIDTNLSDPLPMICRSILLLRISSGFTSYNFVDKMENSSDLTFWWTSRAKENSILHNETDIVDLVDLYADINEAIIDVSFRTTYSNKSFHEENASNILVLKQFQRVCFWGIGL